MSVEQTDTIDAIGVDKETGNVVLTIVDALEWTGTNRSHLSRALLGWLLCQRARPVQLRVPLPARLGSG